MWHWQEGRDEPLPTVGGGAEEGPAPQLQGLTGLLRLDSGPFVVGLHRIAQGGSRPLLPPITTITTSLGAYGVGGNRRCVSSEVRATLSFIRILSYTSVGARIRIRITNTGPKLRNVVGALLR